jgi:DNA-binding LytR/AlgR family response regulator
MEEQLQSTAVVRCHRSFLINVNAIEHVSGNAQGLRLQLVMVSGVEVPVSRSYIPKLRALLD